MGSYTRTAFYLVGTALIAILLSPAARAADMAVKAPPSAPAPSYYNWSGLYIGASFGGGWSNGNLNVPGSNFYGGLSEFIAGGQIGYNLQAGNFLYGVLRELSIGRPSIIRPCRPRRSAP